MPAPTHNETLECVNDAILDSLASTNTNNNNNNHHRNNNGNHHTNNSLVDLEDCADDDSDSKSFESKLFENSKNILDSKIEYEEVNNYNKAILDELKSKYLVLRSLPLLKHNNNNNNNNNNNKNNNTSDYNNQSTIYNNKHKNVTITKSTQGNNGKDENNTSNGNSNCSTTAAAATDAVSNPNKIPDAKYILYPAENIRVSWNSTGSDHKWVIGTGMINVGNTCYLNATLQAIFHIPCMANWLLSDKAHRDSCYKSGDISCIICAVARTLLLTQKEKHAIQPFGVYSRLKFICKHLLFGKQEDAHEFLRYLIESMEESFLLRFPNHNSLDQYSKRTTPLNHIFGGYIKSAVRCLSCNYVSVTYQYFQDLILDIRKVDNIEDALETYFAREMLEDTSYNCESCKTKVSATKQFSIEKIPTVLCIQLKRFSIMMSKITKKVTLKQHINLSKFLSKNISNVNATYRLVSAIIHVGFSQYYGHYTAVGVTTSGGYYTFDDSYVEQIYLNDVCNSSPYIIFYELDKSSLSNNRKLKAPKTINSETVTNDQPMSRKNAFEPSERKIMKSEIIGPKLPADKFEFTKKSIDCGSYGVTSSSNINSSVSANYLDNTKLASQVYSTRNNNNLSNKNNNDIMIHYKSNHTTTMTTTNSTIKSIADCSSVSATSTTSSFLYLDSFYNLNKNGHNNARGIEDENELATEGKKYNNRNDEPTFYRNENKYYVKIEMKKTNVNGESKITGKNNSSQVINGQSKNFKSLVPYNDNGTDDEATHSDASINCNNSKSNSSIVNVDGKPSLLSSDKQSKNSVPMDSITSKNVNVYTKRCDSSLAYEEDISSTSHQLVQKTQHSGSDSSFDKAPTNNKRKLISCSQTSKAISVHGKIESDTESKNKAYDQKMEQHKVKSAKGTKSDSMLAESMDNKANSNNPFSKATPNDIYKRKAQTLYKTDIPDSTNSIQNSTINSVNNDNKGKITATGLGQQSHRGYGAPVCNWTGKQSETDKEIINELKKKALTDQEHADENEMDCGAPKKIKLRKETNRAGTSGNQHNNYYYNPFQEKQNQNMYSKNYHSNYNQGYKNSVQTHYRHRRSYSNNGSAGYGPIYYNKNNSRNRSNYRNPKTPYNRPSHNNYNRRHNESADTTNNSEGKIKKKANNYHDKPHRF